MTNFQDTVAMYGSPTWVSEYTFVGLLRLGCSGFAGAYGIQIPTEHFSDDFLSCVCLVCACVSCIDVTSRR